MRIKNLKLNNFKRFTDLSISDISAETKLVLLIGSNGSGKSCIFDAFDWLNKGPNKSIPYGSEEGLNYYRKATNEPTIVEVKLSDDSLVAKNDWTLTSHPELAKRFIGRSSIRIIPRILNQAQPEFVATDQDSPITYIEHDLRFTTDVYLYIQSINRALREPVFSGKTADTLKIFQDYIEPFNTSLRNIFGDELQTTIRIIEFEDSTPKTPAKLIFQKGHSKINYDYLSHGEKQVIILILNFIVRQEYYNNAIIFIDEMDVHLNTRLQYNTIKEISERWIPENSQLWTASHALGFIDYANDYEKGEVVDFDDYNFDSPQIIKPSAKNDFQIFEIAVSKDFLGKAFQGKTMYFSEQKDAPLYNNLNLENILFFDGKDKLGCFHKAKELRMRAFIDRDYLSDDEIIELKQEYPFLHFTQYYSIENALYHPDNLSEYFATQELKYEKEKYIELIASEKSKQLAYITAGIAKARDGYPFYKEHQNHKKLKAFKNNYKIIIDMLSSDDFETYYKVLPAKDYCTTLPQRQNISRKSLALTNWFKKTVRMEIW